MEFDLFGNPITSDDSASKPEPKMSAATEKKSEPELVIVPFSEVIKEGLITTILH